MEPSCVQQTTIPGTSKLFNDYLYEFERVSRFYPAHFLESDSFARAAKRVQYPEARRARMVSVLRVQNGDSEALGKFADSNTMAVVTGQQVGLLSGPAYTIFKALTAVKLAAHLSENGIPAVPIFWLATEDHDLAEVDHAWVFDHRATPARISFEAGTPSGGPVGDVQIRDLPLDALRRALGELPFADDVIRLVEDTYRPGAKLGVAFHAFLRKVLETYGILYLNPLAPEVREIAQPFLLDAITRIPELREALRSRNDELLAAGYHAQVHFDDASSLLFVINEAKRVPLRWVDGRLVAKDRSYSMDELHAANGRISPNALLRPVMQDYLLPTVSYVAGPSEIAYMAQAEVLYEKLLGRMPVIFPRNSFTLLDAHATKLKDRYDVAFTDLLACEQNVRAHIAARLVPQDIREDLTSARSAIDATLGELRTRLQAFDPTLAAAAGTSSAKVLYQLDKLTRKTARETLHRDERASRDAEYLLNLVYPHRHLQERFYSIAPFLARHGLDLPQRLLSLVQLACPDHMVRTV